MNILDEFENNIQSIYFTILKKKYPQAKQGKYLNCDSFRKIVTELKSIIINCQNQGLGVLETANNIIFNLLSMDFFIYDNVEMAVLIGYLYLKKMGVKVVHYSIHDINKNSSIQDIQNLTATW